MTERIGPKKPLRHYLKEWRTRKDKFLTQQQLADRLPVGEEGQGTSKDVISRWERHQRGISMEAQAALAEALDIEPWQLYQHPDAPTADQLLMKATPKKRVEIIAVIEAMLKNAG